MALSRVGNVQMTLLAFAAGESVSEEAYFGDTKYNVLEGEMPLTMNGKTTVMRAGECVAVPAGTLHAVGGAGAFKKQMLLQEIKSTGKYAALDKGCILVL